METITDNETISEGLDIFVFSNGQEYTPPRKYHLCNNDLHLWDSTLKYLARSLYGSLHSLIELYTIDGVKILNPTEISSGRAYVAVIPPDPFIDSGYNHYLIKASRSWEKSQMRKLNNRADETTVSNGAINIEALKSSKPPHIAVDTTADKTTARRSSIKNGSNSKQIVKYKSLTGQVSQPEHSSILKKINSNSYPHTSPSVSAKTTPIKRRQMANKYSKIPKRIVDKMVTTEKNKTVGQAPVTNIVPEIRKEVFGTNAVTGYTSFIKTSVNNILQKQQLKDHKLLNPIAEDTDDNIVISNLYKNTESDIISSFVDANSGNQADTVQIKGKSTGAIGPSLDILKMGLSFQNPNSIDETNGTINVAPKATAEIATQKTNFTKMFSGVEPITVTGNFSPLNTTVWLTNFTYENTSLPTRQLPDGAPQNTSSNEHHKDGHFVASTNKSDVLNLNVNIEIKNPEVATQVKPNVDTYNSRSLTDEGVDYNGTVTQSKSVQSLLNDYLPRLYSQDDQNLVYIQCACVDDSFRPNPKALCPEVRTCFVLLPVLTRAGRQCCKCDNNDGMKTSTKSTKKSTDFQQPNVNINSSVKDSVVFMKTEHQETHTNTIPGTSQTEFIVNCTSKCEFELCSECGGKKMNVSQTSTSLSEKKTETLSFQRNSKPTQDVCEMSAQTDWCSTMLEARVNSDGRYTFHLPSIQKIKQYNY